MSSERDIDPAAGDDPAPVDDHAGPVTVRAGLFGTRQVLTPPPPVGGPRTGSGD